MKELLIPLEKFGFIEQAGSDINWIAAIAQIDVDNGGKPRFGFCCKRIHELRGSGAYRRPERFGKRGLHWEMVGE